MRDEGARERGMMETSLRRGCTLRNNKVVAEQRIGNVS